MKTLLKIAGGTVVLLLALAILAGPVWTADKDELMKYRPIEFGFCEDVQLPCAKAVLATTDFFFVVFANDGTLLAITKLLPDGTEVVVFGKLPLKKNEKDI